MVRNHTHGDVGLPVFAVGVAGEVANDLDDRLEHVRVIVGRFALQGANQTLESHAGVDYLGWQRLQTAVRLAVVLHEHEVPYLDYLRVVFVDQLAAGHFGFLLSGP